jgi:hypothetical protein
MEEKDDIYKNLVTFLKLFKNRPYHLAKFLLDKNALTDKFSKDIINSDKLSDLDTDGDNTKNQKNLNFTSISQMEDYFQSLLDTKVLKTKTPEQVEAELNKKLDELLKNEKYEDAACLRDYMVMRGIKRKSNF